MILNIPERVMWTAKSAETGELVKGHCIVGISGCACLVNPQYEIPYSIIDIKTLEPMAVKPIIKGNSCYCPNCCDTWLAKKVSVERDWEDLFSYCWNCGLRLDWESLRARVRASEI